MTEQVPDKTGLIFEGDNYNIEIKYSKEAEEKELIKIIPKDGEIIFSTDDIIRLVTENFRSKELAYALSTTDTSFIPSVEVAIPISYIADKDITKGERVQFFAPFTIPAGIAFAMEAHKLCIDKGLDILRIPREEFEDAKNVLMEKSKDFVEAVFKPQIEQVKKLRAAETGKAVI